MSVLISELTGLVASLATLVLIGSSPTLLPSAARWAMLPLLGFLALSHTANALEWLGFVWADVVADHLSIANPLLWGVFLLEIGRAHLSSRVEAGEQQLEFFLEQVPVSIASVAADGRLDAFSAAWTLAFPSSARGRTLADVLVAPLPHLLEAVERCVRDGTEASAREELAVDSSGKRRYYRWALRAWRNPERERPGVLLILEDLTDDVEAESRRSAQADELARIRRIGDVSQLAAGAAHDLNNLLQIVHAASWELEEADGRGARALRHIRSAVETAAVLTKAMLHFGRATPGSMGPVDVVRLIADVQGPLGHAIGRRHELVVRVPRTEAVMVRGNPARLQQALLNLVVNARDAMPRGGQIHVTVEIQARRAVLSVRDSGAGIPEDVRAQLFTPFFTTKGTRGTGLGLGVVRSAVEELHGEVVVESTPGVGTTFCLRIPLLDSAVQ